MRFRVGRLTRYLHRHSCYGKNNDDDDDDDDNNNNTNSTHAVVYGAVILTKSLLEFLDEH